MNNIATGFSLTLIHHKFAICILHQNYLPYEHSILLTISGGQDSLCLLKLIIDFQNRYKWNIGLVHFDHKYRKDMYYNVRQILNIAKFSGIRTYIYEHKTRYSSEIESREWRYRIAIYIASYYQYSIIVTAHTKTDQSETFLQYILRGCGIDSLSSISLKTKMVHKIVVMRPLIMFNRLETLWLSRKFGLPVWSDFTNYEYKTKRNRLREELLPYLQQYFQPQIQDTIQTISNIAKIDSEYLQKATIKLYFLTKHPQFIAINYYIILQQPEALQYRLLKLFFRHNFNMQVTKKSAYNIIQTIQKMNMCFSYIIYHRLKLYLAHDWLYVIN